MPQYTRSNDRGSNGNSGTGTGCGSGGVAVSNHINNKKKFGKNLNKLVKPSAPPIPNDKHDRNMQNGLLLLSTKKPSSGLLASKTNATISANNNGALAGTTGSVHKAGSALNFQTQPSPSTHQVLLSAVVGASQSENQQKHDAWGVANRVKEQHHLHYDVSQNYLDEEKSFEERDSKSDFHLQSNNAEYANAPNIDELSSQYEENAAWDEYGGRGQASSNLNGTLAETDDQRAYMARLAKERAQMKLKEEEARFAEQKARAAQRLEDLDQRKGGNGVSKPKSDGQQQKNGARSLWEPENKSNGVKVNGKDSSGTPATTKAEVADPSDDEPLIHLSSYEDRDRGERGSGATPRMLYDPKSGSMIEVKAKSESSASKVKKGRTKGGKKEREPVVPEVVLKNGRNKPKGRKDTATSSQPEKKKANPNRRFPRTKGVLYKRDGKGGLKSADECDGDLGYGTHSVPGGRVRNVEAYTEWVEENKSSCDGPNISGDFQKPMMDSAAIATPGFSLDLGYAVEETQPIMDWVKADDKIELITGVDDSPTLKPTAKEWAPSVAAIAAAFAAANATKEGSDDASSLVDIARGHEGSEDEEESEGVEGGLGFDPLQGIDFMSSPANLTSRSADELATVGLPSLTLDPPVFSSGSSTEESAITRSFFAFGSSGTWSSDKPSTNGLSGWGAGSGGVGLFGSDAFVGQSDEDSFLTGAASAWGPTVVPGLDRLPAINAADHTGPAD